MTDNSAAGARSTRRGRPTVTGTSRWVLALVLVLVAASVVALLLLVGFWGKAQKSERDLEVVKTCLQVVGVGIFGAVIALLAGLVESSRSQAADRERLLTEEFAIRTALLERTSRCAHAMYVTCQHVGREMRDADVERPRHRERRALDARYLEFATEALALQTEIGARYGVIRGPDQLELPPVVGARESWWRWHQIYDLLAVYYFSLTRNFRADAGVLKNNSKGAPVYGAPAFHSGLDLLELFGPPPDWRFESGEKELRTAYERALPDFADALLMEEAPSGVAVAGVRMAGRR